MAASFGSPKNTPQAPMSPLGAQRAAGMPWINTVSEPLTIGGGGAGGGGGGGCTNPALMTPVQMTVQPTCAAGRPSIITKPIGHGPAIGGPITPDGTSRSWVIGSPLRAAGNTASLLSRRFSVKAPILERARRSATRTLPSQASRSVKFWAWYGTAVKCLVPRFPTRWVGWDLWDTGFAGSRQRRARFLDQAAHHLARGQDLPDRSPYRHANPFCLSATVRRLGVRSPVLRCGRSCDRR